MSLIGMWTLAEVDEGAGAVLRLAPDELSVFDRCGVLLGQWRADAGGLFVADVTGQSIESRSCGSRGATDPSWLRRATGFRVDGDTPVLLDDRGARVARLLPGGTPAPGPNLAPEEAQPPVVTDAVRRALAPAAALPASLTPASRDALLGRWVPAGRAGGPGQAYVELRPGGDWRGSDGCNGQGGRWVVGPGGALLATSGPSTMIGCANVPVATWISGARRAGLDGEVLVLLDVAGKETGRLRRDR